MNLATWLEKSAKNNPKKVAIYDGLKEYATYEELLIKVQTLAYSLSQKGIKKGDFVGIYSHNTPEYLEILYAIWWIGAVCVPINYKLHISEANWILKNANIALLFIDKEVKNLCVKQNIIINSSEYKEIFKSIHPNLSAKKLQQNSLAWIFYTSGTTGRPKGAMLTHENLMATAFGYCIDVDIVKSKFNMLYAAPMSHGAGLYNHIFIRNGSSHIIPNSHGFSEEEIYQLSQKHNYLVMFAAPTMLKRLVAYAKSINWDGDGLQTIIYGGGPMYLTDINDAISQFGDKFVQIYGQGETPMSISVLKKEQIYDKNNKNWQSRITSVGQSNAVVDIKIVDKNFKELNNNQIGEILVSGSSVMQGYLNDEEATNKALVDGWLKTGDLGYFDEDGFLNLTGRSKDVIISGGSNIYPREVEEVLLQHPFIKEVSVVGKKDEEWGEIVVAFISLDTNKKLSVKELDEWCKQEIASFKKPKIYKFLDELPKNSYGKILKTNLRQLL